MHDVDWIEVAYKAYIAAIISLGTLFTSAAIVGDRALGKSTMHDLRHDGPAVLGLVFAVGILLGLRSGCAGRTARTRAGRREPRAPRARRPRGGDARLGVPSGPGRRDVRARRRRARRTARRTTHPEPQRRPTSPSGSSPGSSTGGVAVMAVWGSAVLASGRRLRSVDHGSRRLGVGRLVAARRLRRHDHLARVDAGRAGVLATRPAPDRRGRGPDRARGSGRGVARHRRDVDRSGRAPVRTRRCTALRRDAPGSADRHRPAPPARAGAVAGAPVVPARGCTSRSATRAGAGTGRA